MMRLLDAQVRPPELYRTPGKDTKRDNGTVVSKVLLREHV